MKKHRIRILVFSAILAAAAALTAFSAPAHVRAETETAQEDTSGDNERKTLTITVLEDIPAEEIEEMEVPMAAAPVTHNSLRTGIIAWICVIAAALAAYIVYFTGYKRKLAQLSHVAAEKETLMLEKYRSKRP